MNKIQRNLAFVSVSILTLFFTTSTNAANVIPSDYMIAGNIGDTWTYANLDSTQFTWTLSEVASGPNAGLIERGNNDSGMVYDLTNNVLTIHELNKTPIDPTWDFVFSEIELGQIVTLNDDPVNPSMYLFWDIPNITVQASTFNDVLALVWLDANFSANPANTQLGLDPLITAAVTDIDYYVRGIGQVAFQGIAASTGVSDGSGYELVSTSLKTTEIEAFVTRFYQLCLGRTPDQAGLEDWVSALMDGSRTGRDVAFGFVFSQEFINKNTTNEEYLQVLYEAFFNRQPDPAGMQGWLDAMNSGASREDVLNGFIYATEFNNLCWEYGISPNPIAAFVARFYQLCLGRDPDSGGLQVWADNLLGLVQTGADVAYGFMFSQEFLEKNNSNEDYLTILYKAFFDRRPDQAGWDIWLAELDGGKVRLFVLNGFIYSQEFSQLCKRFGISPFSDPHVDYDGDGFTRNQGDCNDKDPNTYPGAAEGTCSDGIDQDCDGIDLPCPCNDIAERGYLNVLNINLLFSEVQNRDERLENIADFAADNNVDVLLLQEVVSGVLVKTENSAQDLRDILRKKHNMDYNIRTAFEIGLPGLFAVANAVLSRCEIEFSQVTRLPATSELEFYGQVIPIRRNVIMARLKIPEQGNINIYDTHLCARCEIEEREEQLDELLEFVNSVEMNMPGDNPSILGGDFNSDRFDNAGEEKFLYEKIISAGFIDAYAEFAIANSGGQETLDTLCEDEDNADEHCTVGVSELDGPNARRIDYIFTRRPSTIRDAKVVFNTLVNTTEPTVSDHAGVFTSMNLP